MPTKSSDLLSEKKYKHNATKSLKRHCKLTNYTTKIIITLNFSSFISTYTSDNKEVASVMMIFLIAVRIKKREPDF